MIDNPDQVDRLLAKMEAALPVPATVTPEGLAVMRRQAPDMDLRGQCRIIWVGYAGDEGGLICRLAFDQVTDKHAFVVSLTHLRVPLSVPVARDIAAYQKHRVKRLRRIGHVAGSQRWGA